LEPPPTSVGGIPKEFARCSCRLDLNNPPTPVGGIQGACRLRKPDEISIVGSRCGHFEPAFDLFKKGAIELDRLISEEYPLSKGVLAMDRASKKGVLKVLLRP
jgi:hypothetical protein